MGVIVWMNRENNDNDKDIFYQNESQTFFRSIR
jgi:hypothetical protein